MNFKSYYLLCLPWISSAALASANADVIKIAIVENLKLEKLSTDKYASNYLEGLRVAKDSAKESGIEIEFKTFFYDKEPLAILKQVPEIKKWQPDLVIGPRSSSLFLLLADQFSDVMVLSPFATAEDISRMPDNFYSLTYPNKYFTQAVVNAISDKFPRRAVAPIGEADCKNCMNFIDEFSAIAGGQGILMRPAAAYVSKNVETVDPSKLVKNYKQSDVILLPNTSYTSGIVVSLLSDYLKQENLVFVGGDGWGDWTTSYVGKLSSKYKYSAFRVTPWSIDARDPRTLKFHQDVKKYLPQAKPGAASLLSYATVLAAIDAFKKTDISLRALPVRTRLMKAFQRELKLDPNYARPSKYIVYKVTQNGEELDSEISPLLRSKQ